MSTVNPDIGEVAATSRKWMRIANRGESDTDDAATIVALCGNYYASMKPWLDRPLALALLWVSSPIILVSMLLQNLTSRGNWIYTQKRLGLAGRVFTIYKIRTMYEESERDNVATSSAPGDPRVTPVGRFLRWCHIDELPQVGNVLKGDMSLMGMRPESPEFLPQLERALPNYRERLSVRPGLTGLAQVQQSPDRNISTLRRKPNFDLCYVERMSFWLDVRLIAGTGLKCLGVPFFWIGRILQLPDPNPQPMCDSLATNLG
jgi:lipopolysaccharide/colanic/teichoic acid biosynthesis glycosyltransferase